MKQIIANHEKSRSPLIKEMLRFSLWLLGIIPAIWIGLGMEPNPGGAGVGLGSFFLEAPIAYKAIYALIIWSFWVIALAIIEEKIIKRKK
jgi:hypothetical protein